MRSSILILFLLGLASVSASGDNIANLRELKKDKKKEGKEKGRDKDGKKKDHDSKIRKDRFKNMRPLSNYGLESLQSVKPNQAGLMHTAAFEEFALMNPDASAAVEGGGTLSSINVMMDFNQIMGGFCDNADELCTSMASKSTVRAFRQTEEELGVLTFPDSMDQKVADHLVLAQSVIQSMNEENSQDALNILHMIEQDLEALDDVIPEYQSVGVASISVARESAKLWIKVFEDDTHPLHKLVVNKKKEEEGDELAHDRNLQQIDTTSPAINVTIEVNYDLIIDNIQEAVTNAVARVLSTVQGVVKTVNVIITGMVDLAVDTVMSVVNAVKKAAESVVDYMTQVIVTVKDLGVAITQGVVNVATTAVETTIDVANATVQAGIAVADAVIDTTVEAVQTGVEATINLVNTTYQAVDAVVDATVDVAVAVASTAVETVIDVAEEVVETAEEIVEGAVEIVENTIEAIASYFERITFLVNADFAGGATGGAAMVDLVVENPVFLFPINWIPLFVVAVFWYAVPCSAKAAFGESMR